MQFLKKLFNRSSDDDDDDDDFGFDDDDESPSTEVIMDDDLDGNNQSSSGPEDHADLDDIEARMEDDQSSSASDASGGLDDVPSGHMDGDDELGSSDDDDIDFREDDEDDIDFDDDDDDDEEEDGGNRKTLIFAAAGVGVLVLGIMGGAAFWFLGGDATEEVAQAPPPPEGSLQLALPPRAGSLNATGDGALAAAQTDRGEDVASGIRDQEAGAADQPTPSKTGTPAAPSDEEAPPAPSQAATLGASSLNAFAGAGAGSGQGLIIPAATRASFQAVPDQTKRTPLATAPDRRLLQKVEGLDKPLPRTSKDKRRKPWEAYARPLTGKEVGQRVGVLVVGLGLSRAATMAAITKLPGEVSLVFEPYAPDLDDWLTRARLNGHEVFVGLPMESANFPAEDPGPLALTTTVQVNENMKRLHMILSSFGGYVGVVSSMGSKFSRAEGQLKPILAEINKRGLMFVDGGATTRSEAPRMAVEINLPRAKSNMRLDDPPTSGSIRRKLNQLEKAAKDQSTAIATIRAYPTSIKGVAEWARTLNDKKLSLVPVSAIANKQFIE